MAHHTLLARGAVALCSLPLLLGSVGCSDDDTDEQDDGGGFHARRVLDDLPAADVGTPESVQELAGGASAPGVFGIAMVAMMLPQMSEDEACPIRKTEGSVMSFSGGCTDAEGKAWVGEATMESGVGESRVTLEGFGTRGPEECNGVQSEAMMVFDGVIVLGGAPSELRFEVDLLAEVDQPMGPECQVQKGSAGWEYRGSFQPVGADEDGDGQKDDAIWSGSGRVGSNESGVVHAQTEDELISNTICDTEAESGATTLRAGDDTAVITYDGATDCDPEATARWTLNGQDQGELQGISCSAAPGQRAGSPWAAALGVLLGAALARARRR